MHAHFIFFTALTRELVIKFIINLQTLMQIWFKISDSKYMEAVALINMIKRMLSV